MRALWVPVLGLSLLVGLAGACTQTALGLAGDRSSTADASIPLADASLPPDAGLNIPAPQPVWPPSLSKVTSHSPAFRWVLAPGSDGATLELCHTPDCASVAYSVTVAASAASTPSPAALTPGVWFWRLRGTLGGQNGVNVSPTWELVVGPRSAPVSTAWGTILDINRDGYADVAVADRGTTAYTVYVYAGSPNGLSATPWTTAVLPPQKSFSFDSNDLQPAGDVNGDGYADLIVQNTSPTFLLLGGPSGFANAASPILMSAGEAMGVGDVNGDGYGDLASSSRVYLGSPSGPVLTQPIEVKDPNPDPQVDRYIGGQAAAPGDMNGDGFADLVLGFVNDTLSFGMPFAIVFYGGPTGPTFAGYLSDPAGTIPCGGVAQAAAGGDFNGDGYEDVTVFCYDYRSGSDNPYELLGGPSLPAEPAQYAQTGYYSESGVAAMDLNGDGADDMITWPQNGPCGGPLQFDLGQVGGNTSGYELEAGPLPVPGGIAVAGAPGDINGDGYDDVVFSTLNGIQPNNATVAFGAADLSHQTFAPIVLPAGAIHFGQGVAAGTTPTGLPENAGPRSAR
jgi:hypothetical protein